MRIARIIGQRIRSLFARARAEHDLQEEIAIHLEQLTKEYRSAGMTEREATAAARRAFGGLALTSEQCRDTRRVRFLEDIGKDLTYALRLMCKFPGFTATAVLSLAVGIGANTVIFTAIDAVLWKPLAVDHPQDLVRFSITRSKGGELNSFPGVFAARLAGQTDAFAGAIAASDDGVSFSYDGGAERILAAAVSPNYFSMLGVKTALGQPFSPDVRAGRWAAEAVLSYRFWQSRFGGDPAVIGRVIHINTCSFIVAGVSAPSFYDVTRGLDPELRIPMLPEGRSLPKIALAGDPDFDWNIMARLQPGVTLARAASVAEAQFQVLMREPHIREDARRLQLRHVRALPGGRGWQRYLEPFSTPLFVLFGLVAAVLLIACANVANMLLARMAARRRELAVRCSVGAGRGRLVRQMLAESLLLSLAGAGLGIAAAFWAAPLLLHFLPRSNMILSVDLHPDARALLFTLALTAVTCLLFGLAPALHSTSGDLAVALKSDTAASLGDSQTARFRKSLVVVQVAFSLALLITAGWFVRTVVSLRPREMAVDPRRVLLFMVKPQPELYDDQRTRSTLAAVISRIEQIPGVELAALAHPGPYTGSEQGRLLEIPGGNAARVITDRVTPGFFYTVGMKLLAGRDFNDADTPRSAPVAIVNQAAARALFGNVDPIGRTIPWTYNDGAVKAEHRIVGMVGDVRYYNLSRPPEPAVFFTYQLAAPYMPVLHVRTNRADTTGMIAAIRRAFDDVDRGFPVFNIKTMAMQIDDALARERMVADLAAALGVFALLLAVVGLYGVLIWFVTRRRREIGIRMALGSDATSIIWMVIKEALQLVTGGCAVGILLALLLRRSAAGFLFGVAAADLATMCAAALLLLAASAAVVCVPALRASRVDPLVALRDD